MEASRYPVKVNEANREELQRKVGLCADCRFMRRMESDRGSGFLPVRAFCHGCERFPKYPRLPVLQMRGHEASERRQ